MTRTAFDLDSTMTHDEKLREVVKATERLQADDVWERLSPREQDFVASMAEQVEVMPEQMISGRQLAWLRDILARHDQ